MTPPGHPTRELATVLFTDIVDSTSQLERSGDQVWARVLDAVDSVTRSEVRRRGGELVKSTGDGALALLPSPSAAVECAAALHAAAVQLGVTLRIGAHTGEVERRGLDVAGLAVHVAARMMGAAGAGETLVSEVVQVLASAPSELFDDRGRLELKGVAEPMRAFAIQQPETEPAPVVLADTDVGTVARLIDRLRFEEAAELADAIDPQQLVEVLVTAGGRIEFLDVDVTLVRMLRDLLERLPVDDAIGRSRTAAKLAFELRGDPSTVDERRELLATAADLAALADDPIATSDALLAGIHALWEPAGATDRLAAAEQVIALTRRTHHVDHELEARLARVQALVQLWQVHDAGLELATYARLGARLDRPEVDTYIASRRAMLAEISGRYDELARQGEIAYRQAVRARMPDAERLRLTHLWAIARDVGTDASVFDAGLTALRELAVITPGNFYELDCSYLLLELGRTGEARVELARGLPPLFTSTGPRWLLAACHAAEVAAAVGSENECGRVYDVLLPQADQLVVNGPNFVGAVADRLGLLEVRLGRVDVAIERLTDTVARLDAIAALPWVARTRAHLAQALRAAGDVPGAEREHAFALETARSLGMHRFVAQLEATEPSDSSTDTWSLRRDGDDWLLDAHEEHVRLRANRGLQHLAILLTHPHRDIAALQLDSGETSTPAQDGVPLVDDQALVAYRRRLDEIVVEQESADRSGDEAAAHRLLEERELLLAELRRATGLGGRRRTTGSSDERARVNVTRNLKRAIEQIQQVAPLAGAHLAGSVRTGTQCRYEPPGDVPSGWEIQG